MKPTVCLLDDDDDIRASLKLVFKSRNIPFMAFENAEEFFEAYNVKSVGCVILDLKMPDRSGLDILNELRNRNIMVPVILLTGHADVPTTVAAMKAGAFDVLEKPVEDSVLIEKVQEAFAQADEYRNFASERQTIEPKMQMLTPREIEVLDLMVSGKKNRRIADELGISTKTLDIHRANIMRKMHTKTIADLVRWRLIHKAELGGPMPVVVR